MIKYAIVGFRMKDRNKIKKDDEKDFHKFEIIKIYYKINKKVAYLILFTSFMK